MVISLVEVRLKQAIDYYGKIDDMSCDDVGHECECKNDGIPAWLVEYLVAKMKNWVE